MFFQCINDRFDDCTNENKTEHNKISTTTTTTSYIPDHPYRILITGGSGPGKTIVLLNLIENQPGIDKKYLYAKDPYEVKYQYLINIRQKKAQIIMTILRLILSIQTICMMFTKILMNTIKIKIIKI